MLHTNQMRRVSGFIGFLSLALAALSGGCATIDNDRLTVAGAELPAFAGAGSPLNQPLREATGPSLTGMDRSNWDANIIAIRSDGVRHHPHYTRTGPVYDRSLARHQGLSPSALSATDAGSSLASQVWEGWAAPVWAGADVLLVIPRAILRGGPFSATASPGAAYQRGMGMTDAASSEPALDAEVAPIGASGSGEPGGETPGNDSPR